MTRSFTLGLLAATALAGLAGFTGPADAGFRVQCEPLKAQGIDISDGHNVVCKHLTAGDGFITMADQDRSNPAAEPTYIFGFSDVTPTDPTDFENSAQTVQAKGRLAASFPAPAIVVDEGDDLYLTLSNIGFAGRPDLFDPHTVHYHGFPNASNVFDGEPEASFGINVAQSLTYFYRFLEPGTYMYHCHQEAAEHMQMGMLGITYVRPKQNKLAEQSFPNGFQHKVGNSYVYNDGDGETVYDVEVPLQIAGFDPSFHKASVDVQPPPFAFMEDAYPLLNGRGYPETANPAPLSTTGPLDGTEHVSQPMSALVQATQGQKVLLRISSLDVQRFYTLGSQIPMKIVGKGARIFRGGGKAEGVKLAHLTNSVTVGGGESVDVIIDTQNVPPGRYFLYTTNLNYLSNGDQDFGGLMTEFVIAPASGAV